MNGDTEGQGTWLDFGVWEVVSSGEFNFLGSSGYDEDITLPFIAAASWQRTSFWVISYKRFQHSLEVAVRLCRCPPGWLRLKPSCLHEGDYWESSTRPCKATSSMMRGELLFKTPYYMTNHLILRAIHHFSQRRPVYQNFQQLGHYWRYTLCSVNIFSMKGGVLTSGMPGPH